MHKSTRLLGAGLALTWDLLPLRCSHSARAASANQARRTSLQIRQITHRPRRNQLLRPRRIFPRIPGTFPRMRIRQRTLSRRRKNRLPKGRNSS